MAGLGGGPSRAFIVGTASAIGIREVYRRKKLYIVNDSDSVIYANRGDRAVLNAGIRLNANGGSILDEPDIHGRMYDGPWAFISTGANKNLCYSEDR